MRFPATDAAPDDLPIVPLSGAATLIAVDAIDATDRLRPVDKDIVTALADSIKAVGLQNPVSVRRIKDRFTLISGAHRLAAIKHLGRDHIPAMVTDADLLTARLAEIDENLVRHELSPLDRAIFLAERKRIYEDLHPETRKGGRNQHTALLSDTMSFSENAAEKLRVSKKSIERSVSIHKGLTTQSLARVRKLLIATSQAELLHLSKCDAQKQAAILDRIEAGHARTVREAEAKITGRTGTMAPNWETDLRAMQRRWKTMAPKARNAFVHWLADSGQMAAHLEGTKHEPDTEGYASAAEIAGARLPGLPGSKKGILELAGKAGWDFIESYTRGGKTRLYAIADLPVQARAEYERRRKIAQNRLIPRAEARTIVVEVSNDAQ